MVVNMSMEVLAGNEEEINLAELVNNPEELLQWIHKKQNELLEIGSQMKMNENQLLEIGSQMKMKDNELLEIGSQMKMNDYEARPPLYIRVPGTKRNAESMILEDKKRPIKKPRSVKKNGIKPRPVAAPPIPVPAPVIPGELMTAITDRGGEDVMWVMEKLLQKTDVNWHHDRLSIPESRVATNEFLTTTEKIKVSKKIKIPVEVVLLVTGGEDDEGPRTQSRELNFTKWYMKNCGIYVLISKWCEVARDNSLAAGDKIQVWSFRKSQEKKLSIAINVIRGEPQH
ncbi:putative B3 domain-containing protein At3g24850 [Macadamia integrifolia]|uniref:putative B3 domain-containing protein At3g24850 n=1 Tax=Macadamia integrifolia TaxID=60698 RepID=UPI001C4F90BE|nr:putative B3 domain-containing protein At3g24850 [Macadamia integrifolia]XP_042498674.1 putative B3 domain-containing protein At3g24850 [Macadamia integrifolia]XP_042498685.1 putative B3 domain-containing protein At3g24850 [Macadamia integrifolia]